MTRAGNNFQRAFATNGIERPEPRNDGREGASLRKFVTALVLLILLGAGAFAYLNRIYIADWLSAKSFTAPEEITAIENKIGLTDRASLMFAATHPALEDQDTFNHNCESYNKEISVLGCYGAGRIHLYNIKSSDLTGVVESTAAHELLHAAWERMGAGEKTDVSKLLNDVYNDEKYHDLLAEDLGTYEEKERLEELHSRIGTEIADLPEGLEKHYAKYFNNQDLVVDFYNSYITPFHELSEEMDALSEELEQLDAEITAGTGSYYQTAEALSAKIDEFNRCANTSGCFATDAIFNARRAELVAEQTALEDKFNELNEKIEHYNALVAEYNANVLRGEALENAMNSNAKVETIK